MKQFKIYEIPGVKIGATDRWPKRVREQGYKEEDCKVLFETDVLKLASSMERVLQKRHGYKVDTVRYETTYNASHGKVVSEETRAKHSVAAIKRNAEIAADPVRAATRSANHSKANAELAADPVRSMQRSVNMSKAQSELAADPVRVAQRSVNMSRRYEIKAEHTKLSTAAKNRGPQFKTKVSIHGVIYNGANFAARELGVNPATLSYRCRSTNFSNWFYI